MSFPVSPTNGQTTIVNGITYTYNSNVMSWTRVTISNLASLSVIGASSLYGNTVIANTTQSTSTTSGALQVAGGVGILGNLNVGGTIQVNGSINFTNTSSAAFQGTIGSVAPALAFFTTATATTVEAATIGNVGANLVGSTLTLNDYDILANIQQLQSFNTSFSANAGGLYNSIQTTNSALSSYETSTNANVNAINSAIAVFYSNATGGSLAVNTVQAATIGNTGTILTGTLSTASQPNLTTLAGMTSFGTTGVTTTANGNLTVTGNLNVQGTVNTINNTIVETTEYVTTIYATTVNASTIGNTGAVLTGTLSTAYQPNITVLNTVAGASYQGVIGNVTPTTGFFTTANATLINASTIGNIGASIVGSGASLTNLNASNLSSGTVPSAQISGSYSGITQTGTLGTLTVTGAINGGSVSDNGNRVLTNLTSIGTGNLALSVSAPAGTTLTLAQTGPGAVQFGGATQLPTLTTDLYGRVSMAGNIALNTIVVTQAGNSANITANASTGPVSFDLTNTTVSAGVYGAAGFIPQLTVDTKGRVTSVSNVGVATSTYTLNGTSGTTPVSGGTTLTMAGTYGVTVTVGAEYANISTPQDLRTTASPSFAGLTVNGTAVVTALNSPTIGNTGATLTGTVGTASQPSITTLAGVTSFGTGGVTTTAQGNLTVSGNLNVQGTINTINNTIIETTEYVTTVYATTLNAVTIGNIGANHVGTGTYLSGLSASNLSLGTVPLAQLSGITSTQLSASAGITNAQLTNSSVTVTAGTGLSGGGAVSLGGSVTLTNAGVTSAVAGTGISVNSTTGAVTVTNSGVLSVTAGTGITANVATGNLSITNSGVTSLVAGTDISVSAGTGAVTVNDTSTLNSVTGRGASTTNTMTTGSIVPSANLTYNLGSSTVWWNNIYGVSSQSLYADLAENYRADANYAPGTVLVFGGEQEVTVSSVSHDPRVAGVVSTNPAYLMNSALTNGIPVALTGRVPCMVQGPVSKGDRLVNYTNGVAGRLDTSQYEYGCIIGKSLDTIDDNTVKLIEIVVGRV